MKRAILLVAFVMTVIFFTGGCYKHAPLEPYEIPSSTVTLTPTDTLVNTATPTHTFTFTNTAAATATNTIAIYGTATATPTAYLGHKIDGLIKLDNGMTASGYCCITLQPLGWKTSADFFNGYYIFNNVPDGNYVVECDGAYANVTLTVAGADREAGFIIYFNTFTPTCTPTVTCTPTPTQTP